MPRKPIREYITVPEGWTELPNLLPLPDGEEQYFTTFLGGAYGMQVMASVKPYYLHVSIGPVYSMRKDLAPADLQQNIMLGAGGILEAFFPGRQFAKQPDDARKPDVKHFFSLFAKGEE